MAKKMTDLREALFDTLDKVRNGEMPIERASQICEISKQIIDSANAETLFIKTINATTGSGFLEIEDKKED
jgi:hypothetical protein